MLPENVHSRIFQTYIEGVRTATVIGPGSDAHALGAVHVAGVDAGGAGDAAPVEEELAAVREGVFHGIGVEVLIHERRAIPTLAVMTAAQCLGLDRPAVLHPAEMVDEVDKEVAEAPAAGPEEGMEVPYLVIQIADAGRPGQQPGIGA